MDSDIVLLGTDLPSSILAASVPYFSEVRSCSPLYKRVSKGGIQSHPCRSKRLLWRRSCHPQCRRDHLLGQPPFRFRRERERRRASSGPAEQIYLHILPRISTPSLQAVFTSPLAFHHPFRRTLDLHPGRLRCVQVRWIQAPRAGCTLLFPWSRPKRAKLKGGCVQEQTDLPHRQASAHALLHFCLQRVRG